MRPMLAAHAFALTVAALAGCVTVTPAPIVVADRDPAAVADREIVAVADRDREAQPAQGFGGAVRIATGLEGHIFALPEGTSHLPDFDTLQPIGSIFTRQLDVTARRFDAGFPGVSNRFEWFGIDYRGTLNVTAAGEYRFRLTADDGAKLFIDGETVIDDDGVHPPTAVEGTMKLGAGRHRIHVPYFQGPRWDIALVLEVAPPGEPFRVLRVDQPLGARQATTAEQCGSQLATVPFTVEL